MKIGVTSYSFDAYLSSGRLTIYDLPRYAKELGFEGIEFAGIMEGAQAPDLERLRESCLCAGIPVCGYCTSADFTGDVESSAEWVRSEIDRASALGAPVLRTDIYHGDPVDPYREEVILALRALAQYAKSKGVVLTTENHGGYFCRADRLERLFQAVGEHNFGLLADTGNFMDADESPHRSLSRAVPWIRHVHLKDFHFKSGEQLYPGDGWYVTRGGNYIRCAILGHGDAQLFQCLKVLSAIGYDGYLVYEFEGIEDVEQALKLGLSNARRLLQHLPLGVWSQSDA